MDKSELEEFAIELTDKCPTHKEWLMVMNFGMGTLVKNQLFLIELIFKEAERLAKLRSDAYTVIDGAVFICSELGLRFECEGVQE
jgi:hypothetical protein